MNFISRIIRTPERKQSQEPNIANKGYIDMFASGYIQGWVVTADKSRKIDIFLNETKITTIIADHYRPDVDRLFNYPHNSGFNISLYKEIASKIVEQNVIIFSSNGNVLGNGVHNFSAEDFFSKDLEALNYSLGNESLNRKDYDRSPYIDESYISASSEKLSNSQKLLPLAIQYFILEAKCKTAPSAWFDPNYYLDKYPDLATLNFSLLTHYINHGKAEGRARKNESIPLDTLEEAYKLQKTVEPSLPAIKIKNGHLPIIHPSGSSPSQDRILKKLAQVKIRPNVIICLPFLKRGGAEKYASLLTSYFQRRYGTNRTLLVTTCGSDTESRDWFGAQTRILNISDELSHAERLLFLEILVRSSRPYAILNINSKTCWDLYTKRGLGLKNITKLLATGFCFDYNEAGIGGYLASHLAGSIEHIDTLFTDNKKIQTEISDLIGLTQKQKSKMVNLYHAYDFTTPEVSPKKIERRLSQKIGYTKKILWAGRLDKQKRVDLLVDIAHLMPDYEFHIYGKQVLDNERKPLTFPRNCVLHGGFSKLEELNLEQYDLYLYTSGWDGIPTILINLSFSGIPIVASNVGGISELIPLESGMLLPPNAEAKDYSERITHRFWNPTTMLEDSKTLKKHVEENFSVDSLYKKLNSIFGENEYV